MTEGMRHLPCGQAVNSNTGQECPKDCQLVCFT